MGVVLTVRGTIGHRIVAYCSVVCMTGDTNSVPNVLTFRARHLRIGVVNMNTTHRQLHG